MGSKPLAMFSHLSGVWSIQQGVAGIFPNSGSVVILFYMRNAQITYLCVLLFLSLHWMAKEGMTSSTGLGDLMGCVCSNLGDSAFREERQVGYLFSLGM